MPVYLTTIIEPIEVCKELTLLAIKLKQVIIISKTGIIFINIFKTYHYGLQNTTHY